MPSFCTCGVELPPDARFCHKCGKPQYELLPLDPEEIEQPPEPAAILAIPVPAVAAEINFRNPIAVRTGMLMAMIGFMLSSLPIPPHELWLLFTLLMAGFLAVYLYIRRTGVRLSLVSGARMGAITGIFGFTISVVFFTLSVAILSTQGGFAKFYRDQLEGRMGRPAEFEQFLQFLQTPVGFATVIFVSVGMLFALFVIFPTLGGVLGAKVFERDRA